MRNAGESCNSIWDRFRAVAGSAIASPVGDFNFGWIRSIIQLGRYTQAALVFRAAQAGQQGVERSQRRGGPIEADGAEQAMFHRIPLAGSRGIVTDRDADAVAITPLLQRAFPQSWSAAVAPAAIAQQQQSLGLRIVGLALALPPIRQRIDREGGGGGWCHADMPTIGQRVINAVGRRPAARVIDEVVGVDRFGFLPPDPAGILRSCRSTPFSWRRCSAPAGHAARTSAADA